MNALPPPELADDELLARGKSWWGSGRLMFEWIKPDRSPGPAARDLSRRAAMAILLAILILGTMLRLLYIGRRELWLDEASTWMFAIQPLGVLLRELPWQETNPPLYYILIHFVLALFGNSETALRLVSLLASCATIWVVYLLGRIALGRRGGLYAAAFMATASAALLYAQEARSYALVALLDPVAVLGIFLVLKARSACGNASQRTFHGWALFVVAADLSIYAHYTSFFFVAACCLATGGWCLLRRDYGLLFQLAAASAILAVGSGFALVWAANLHASPLIAWIPRPWLKDSAEYLSASLGFAHLYFLRPLPDLAFVVILLAAIAMRRMTSHLCLLSLAIVGLDLAILFLVSQVSSSVFLEKTLFPLAALVSLLVGYAIEGIPGVWRRNVIFAAVLLPALWSCRNYYQVPRSSDRYAEAEGFLHRILQPGDVVLSGPGIAYYRSRTGDDFPLRLVVKGLPAVQLPGVKRAEPDTAFGSNRLFLVVDPSDDRAFLDRPGEPVEVARFGRDSVLQLTGSNADTP